MKVCIAGSRTIHDLELVKKHIVASRFKIDIIANGGAKGVDFCGVLYAQENKIPVKNFWADWDKHGRSAGIIRNAQMADYVDAAVILIESFSRGAYNMLTQINSRQKRFYAVFLRDGEPWQVMMDPKTLKDHSNGVIEIDTRKRPSTKDEDGVLRFFESSD